MIPAPTNPDPKNNLPAEQPMEDARDWELFDHNDWALYEEFRERAEGNNAGAPKPAELENADE